MFKRAVASLALGLILPGSAVAEPVLVRFDEQQILKTILGWLDRRPASLSLPAMRVAPVPNSLAGARVPAELEYTPPLTQGNTAIGRLLFVNTDGAFRSCTATLLGRYGMLVTTANCVVNRGGTLNEDLVFVTALGTKAQRLYSIDCVSFPGEWLEHPEPAAWRFNYAFLKIQGKSTFGGMGVTNAFPPRMLGRMGFSDTLDSRKQMESGSGVFITGTGLVGSRYDELSAGGTGNPWVRQAIVRTLSSHYDPARPEIILGPMFTSATMNLMNSLRERCKATPQ